MSTFVPAGMRCVHRIARAAGTAWLGFGLVLGAALGLEFLYRAQAALRAAVRSGVMRASGGAAADLNARVTAEAAVSADRVAWRPYVYYRRQPFAGAYITVDSNGLRRTMAPARSDGGPTRDILVFGASPMWGTNLPDSATIPTRLASALWRAGISDARVTNYAEAGYTVTQELIALLLALRAGRRPAVVLFYDGYNDVAAAIGNGYAGATKGEVDRARDFALGRVLYTRSGGLASDMRVLKRVGQLALGRVQLYSRFRPEAHPPTGVSDSALVEEVAQSYTASLALIAALGRQFHFTPVFAWMPLLEPSVKPVTQAEQQILRARPPEDRRLHSDIQRVRQRVLRGSKGLEPRPLDISLILARDTITDFEDDLGHTSIEASGRIANYLASMVAPVLSTRVGGAR